MKNFVKRFSQYIVQKDKTVYSKSVWNLNAKQYTENSKTDLFFK